MKLSYSLGSLLGINEVRACLSDMKREPYAVWIPETWGAENFAMQAVAACHTKTAKIGSSIINVYSRSPALVSMGAVTVDTISDGRLVLGLGSSSPAMVERLHGLDFKDPLRRVREYMRIVRAATSGGMIESDMFGLHGFRLLTKPVRDHIPIYLAAVNRGMMGLAWDAADGVILYLRPKDEMRDTVSRMQSGRKIEVACQIVTCVSEDLQAAERRAKRTIAFYVAVGHIYRRFLAAHGYRTEAERILEEYKRFGTKNIHGMVSDEMLYDLAICATPRDAQRQLDGFVRAGITMPVLQFNPTGNTRESFAVFQEAFA